MQSLMESAHSYHQLDINKYHVGCLRIYTVLAATCALVGVILLGAITAASHWPAQSALPLTRASLAAIDIGGLIDARLQAMDGSIDDLNQSVKSLRGENVQVKKDLKMWKAIDGNAIVGIQSKLDSKVGRSEFEALLQQINKTLVNKVNDQQLKQAIIDVTAKVYDHHKDMQNDVQMLVRRSCRLCENCSIGSSHTCSEWTSFGSPAGSWSATLGSPAGSSATIPKHCWQTADRVRILPGSRYSNQNSGCARVPKPICHGHGYVDIKFDDGYSNGYEYSDLTWCSSACWAITFECRDK